MNLCFFFKFCANYIVASLPINQDDYNLLLCGTYYGNSKCMQAKYDSVQFGLISKQ